MPFVHAPTLPELAAPLASTASPVRRITAPALVDARWLTANLHDVRVIDARTTSAHAAGHVPGSICFPLDALLVEDTSRPALERLARAAQASLAAHGIDPDEHVVLVDDADGSASLGAAVCELAGMRHVTVVHGSGVDAWRALGGELATEPTALAPVDPGLWHDTQPRTSTVAAFEDLVDAVVDRTAHIVDARSQLEHEGIVGAPCCGGRGAIPHGIHLEWTELFDMAGSPLPSDRVRAIAAHVGLEPDDRIIVSCHAGHRAAIAARVLRSAGFRDARVSLGSWHEWSIRGLVDDELDPT